MERRHNCHKEYNFLACALEQSAQTRWCDGQPATLQIRASNRQSRLMVTLMPQIRPAQATGTSNHTFADLVVQNWEMLLPAP
jgi:hypothetical protein